MTYKEKAQDIYNQLGQGKLLDAFDQYYAEEVVMTEPRGTRSGKAECRKYEEEFLDSVKEFHDLKVSNIGSNEKDATSFVESTMDVTFTNGQRAKMEQVAVQQWKGDHIIHERFYYNNEN
ncbi:nuclear transport factor 2 family protein [Sediminibacter sp. Hel_I_10]|uniref:nuclear transport factor 2 family protein n=1 Tax=Sediminibacter sp. Hel_I_10 TaxID=1392490 RepID=UPI00047EB0BB|nr:nuclear transport factor 2 family protein [Sediminibacter sp. Hel_I_10]